MGGLVRPFGDLARQMMMMEQSDLAMERAKIDREALARLVENDKHNRAVTEREQKLRLMTIGDPLFEGNTVERFTSAPKPMLPTATGTPTVSMGADGMPDVQAVAGDFMSAPTVTEQMRTLLPVEQNRVLSVGDMSAYIPTQDERQERAQKAAVSQQQALDSLEQQRRDNRLRTEGIDIPDPSAEGKTIRVLPNDADGILRAGVAAAELRSKAEEAKRRREAAQAFGPKLFALIDESVSDPPARLRLRGAASAHLMAGETEKAAEVLGKWVTSENNQANRLLPADVVRQRIDLAAAEAGASTTARLKAEKQHGPSPADKPMSAEASKVLSVATTVLPEIEQLKAAIQKQGRVAIGGIISGADAKLTRLAENVADKIGRLRSGGAINKQEEQRFMGQIARLWDLPIWSDGGKSAVEALEGYATEARSVADRLKPGSIPNQPKQENGTDTVSWERGADGKPRPKAGK